MSKLRTGIVVSNRGEKTAIVRIDRMVPHEKYGKRYRVSKRFAVHDERNEANIGDTVSIQETLPISKTKQWKIVGITASTEVTAPTTEQPTKPQSRKTTTKSSKKATKKEA